MLTENKKLKASLVVTGFEEQINEASDSLTTSSEANYLFFKFIIYVQVYHGM